MHFISTIAFFMGVLPTAFAICCPSDAIGHCADQTIGTPCCATGGCNVFCCNCDGHCRNPRTLRSLQNEELGDSMSTFDAADVDGTGQLTLPQYLKFMNAEDKADVYTDYFNKHDKDGNGVLTKDEIDM